MGLDAHAMVVVGEIVEEKGFEVMVTRYNEKTGKPYQTKEIEDRWLFRSDKSVAILVESLLEFALYEGVDFCFHGTYEEKTKVYGIVVSETDSHRHSMEPVEVDLSKIEKAKKEYLEKVNREPKVYTVLNMSY